MLLGVKLKQPDERLDYDFIYDDWFGIGGDSIDTVIVNVRGSTSMTATPALPEPRRIKVWLDGGTNGDSVTVEVTITTLAGRIKQDELQIQIQEF